jgi:predicted DNA-binding protein (MmcQ/YjbR family)
MKKAGVTEEFPFGSDTLVFKVMGKMFVLTSLEYRPLQINVKCDPESATELRERYAEVTPAYHMNKKHWNSVETGGSLREKEILKMIDDSYDLVVSSLPKKILAELKKLS